MVPNLEKLILECCTNLSEIHPSIKDLQKFSLLTLKYCTSLERFQKEITSLSSLQILTSMVVSSFANCLTTSSVCRVWGSLTLEKLAYQISHHLSYAWPWNVSLLQHDSQIYAVEYVIRKNIIHHTTGKWLLPGNVCAFLTRLNLTDCQLTGEGFPEYLGKLACLTYLDLSNNPFSLSFPSELIGCPSLNVLSWNIVNA